MKIIKGATIVNEGLVAKKDVVIEGDQIVDVLDPTTPVQNENAEVIDAEGLYLLPGMIDDQVHFREPGLTHKAEIYTESRAAAAGGITSFMEMPNTNPQTTTVSEWENKMEIAAKNSHVNYSFFFGATNENEDQVLAAPKNDVAGIKIFMGSSTGNMLVDNRAVLEKIFSKSKLLIATHCEDEATIRKNTADFISKYGEDMAMSNHPLIRSEEACYLSSSLAVEIAKKHDTRLHILHISTAKELSLFANDRPLSEKRITAEACIHHLWFTDADYDARGTHIKWNPAVKKQSDRDAIVQAVSEDIIDIIATDHAPHTLEEKSGIYTKAPSGGPLVQHAVVAVLELVKQGKLSLTKAVEKMSHAPAICFDIKDRGYIKKGYKADLVLVDLNDPWTVTKPSLLYKCGWSPFEGDEFSAKIISTLVNGQEVYNAGGIVESAKSAQAVKFSR